MNQWYECKQEKDLARRAGRYGPHSDDLAHLHGELQAIPEVYLP